MARFDPVSLWAPIWAGRPSGETVDLLRPDGLRGGARCDADPEIRGGLTDVRIVGPSASARSSESEDSPWPGEEHAM
jgi:hypothetical protein